MDWTDAELEAAYAASWGGNDSGYSDSDLEAAYFASQQPQLSQPSQPESFGSAFSRNLSNAAGSVGSGLLFGAADEAAALTRSGIASAQELLGFEPSFQDYSSELAAIRGQQKQFSDQHPYVDTGLQIAGGVALPSGLYRNGATLASRLGLMAAEGAGYGAAYGFGSAEGGLENRATNAAIQGTVGGVAAPAVGAVLGRRMLRPVEDVAASKLAPYADDIARIPSVTDDPFYQYRTLAEATQNPEIAQLEQELGKTFKPMNTAMAQRTAERQQAQTQALKGISSQIPMLQDEGGAAMRMHLTEGADAERRLVNEAFNAIDQGGAIPLQPLSGSFQSKLANEYQAGGVPRGLASIKDDLAKQSSISKPFSFMQDLRERVGQEWEQLKTTNDLKGARVANDLKQSIDSALESASKSGGISPDAFSNFKDALAAHTEYARKYQGVRGVGRVLQGKGAGQFNDPDSSVVGALWNGTPERTRQTLSALPDSPEALETYRGVVRDRIVNTLKMVTSDDVVRPGKFREFLHQNKAALSAATDDGKRLFDDEHMKLLEQLSDELAFLDNKSPRMVKNLAHQASRGQPTTAQQLMSWGATAVKSHPLISPGMKIADWIASKRANKINDVLSEALMDKEFAKTLLSNHFTRESVSVLNRFADSATRAAAVVSTDPYESRSSPESSAKGSDRNQLPTEQKNRSALQQPTPTAELSSNTSYRPLFAGSNPMKMKPAEVEKVVADIVPEEDRKIFMALLSRESGTKRDKKTGEVLEFDTEAQSHAGAKGLAQLMPQIIKAFNVSDPFDPYESVRGGYELFREEKQRFGDIELALAAYNAGSPAVRRAIKKAGSKDFDDIRPHLPKETRDYVTAITKALSA